MRHRLPSLLPILLSTLLLASTAVALPEDREQPIQLQADRASFEQRTGISVYEGNVEVSQGTMYLAADRATVHFDDSGRFTRMEAIGSPTRFRYQPSAERPPIDGVGDRIDYDARTGLVRVIGNARFVQGGDEFSGERIEYDLNRDVVNASGREGERIQFTIQPRP